LTRASLSHRQPDLLVEEQARPLRAERGALDGSDARSRVLSSTPSPLGPQPDPRRKPCRSPVLPLAATRKQPCPIRTC